MAEEIEIGNVGGANGVASEATLKALLDVMSKKDPSGKSTKEVEKYNNALRSGVTVSTKNTDALNDGTKATQSATKATSEFSAKLRGAALGAIGAIAGSIGNLGKEFLNGGSQLGDFTQHLPLVGNAIAPLVGLIDDSVNSFRQLSSIGAGFNNSITEMRRASAEMGLSLDEMSSFVSANSETLAIFGNSVQDGFNNFRNVNRELKDIGEWQQLKNLGFTVEEINEGIASYGALQSRLGRLQGMNQQELATGSANYLKQINMLAKVTGKSREELENQANALAADASFRAMARRLEGEQLDNFTASMQLIDSIGGSTAVALKDLADGVPQTEEAIALIAQAGPEVQYAMERVAQGADPQILLDALAVAGNNIEAQSDAMGAAGLTGIRQTNAAYGAVADEAYKLREIGARNVEAAEQQADAQDAATQELTSFDDRIREVRSAIQTALIDSGLFDTLATSLGTLSAGIGEAAPHVIGWLQDFVNIANEGGFGAAITEKIINPMKDSIIDGLKKLWEDNKIIGSIVGALGALFVGAKITGALKSAIGGLFGAGGASSGPGGSGPGGGRNTGAGVGRNVGGFVGGIAGGAMEGAAKGIAAFADPRIPIGAAALGAAIVAIGAGVAGAAWIMGNALPTFANGMKSFEDLDGAKLASAGDGMVAVGLGFAAFGAGGVAAGIGGIVGGISEGLVGLFGGDDPLTKIKRFGDADIDGVKVKANAEAMIAFGNAMQSAGIGNAAAGAGGIVGAISSFFADDPTEQVKDFGALNINAEGVVANANAMMVMAQGISSLASSGISELKIDSEVIEGFEDLARIGSGLTTTGTGMAAIGSVTGLDTNISSLNSLDRSGIRRYNEELERMVELLESMNTELSKDNNGMFASGTGTNAGTVMNAMADSGTGGGELSSSMLAVLEEIREVNKQSKRALEDIARNV